MVVLARSIHPCTGAGKTHESRIPRDSMLHLHGLGCRVKALYILGHQNQEEPKCTKP